MNAKRADVAGRTESKRTIIFTKQAGQGQVLLFVGKEKKKTFKLLKRGVKLRH